MDRLATTSHLHSRLGITSASTFKLALTLLRIDRQLRNAWLKFRDTYADMSRAVSCPFLYQHSIELLRFGTFRGEEGIGTTYDRGTLLIHLHVLFQSSSPSCRCLCIKFWIPKTSAAHFDAIQSTAPTALRLPEHVHPASVPASGCNAD